MELGSNYVLSWLLVVVEIEADIGEKIMNFSFLTCTWHP